MAWDFSKINFINRLDARSRVLVLLASLVVIVLVVYLGTRFIFGGGKTTGTSQVAKAPNIQSVPGSQLTPAYYQTLTQAQAQATQQAQISGTSAVPTLINTGAVQTGSCVICSDQSANVKNELDNWTKSGLVSPDVASELETLADKNVPVSAYADELQRLVKEGKLTPEQARQLLDEYKKQHANALLGDSEKAMDAMIKSGQLPLDAASQLLTDQKNKVSPAAYGAALQKLASDGKITPDTAQQLLGQYTQQRTKEILNQSIAVLDQMTRAGQITPDVEKTLIELENRLVPADTFATTLDTLISQGKITPVYAAKVLEEYNAQKAEMGPASTIAQMEQEAEAAAYQELNDLLKAGKITADVASQIAGMIQKNVSEEEFDAAINQLVAQKKLTPEIAKLKIADYHKVKQLRDLAQRLGTLQGNNASPDDIANELKRDVQSGILTPDQAAALMRQYQAASTAPTAPATIATGPGNEAFAQLQQRVATGTPTGAAPATASQFNVPPVDQSQQIAAEAQARQDRINALTSAMTAQATSLVAAWQPPTQQYVEGSYTFAKSSTSRSSSSALDNGLAGASGAPLIKAGTILFAVLDTGVNSDYPNSPVLATIVLGEYKGAKLLGQLVTTQSVAGQMDRVLLNFSLMNMDQWATSKSITAYAINPDDARSALASSVNYHYLMRFGAIMGTSFLQGFANAISSSGSTSTTGIFGTSTVHPVTTLTQNIEIGLGQVGTTLGNAIQNYVNIPPTVKVDSGVGLGILFMADVT